MLRLRNEARAAVLLCCWIRTGTSNQDEHGKTTRARNLLAGLAANDGSGLVPRIAVPGVIAPHFAMTM
jgi:hypothetical protein